jgi:Ca2+-binding RTX toxin-like protein
MPEFASVIQLSALDGANGFRLDGIASGDRSGFSVASAGDINGDGFADLIIGAYGAGNSTGESYVVFGRASGFAAALDLSTLDGTNGFRLDGIDAGDSSGRSVASAGDVNGDGFADIVIGAGGGDPGGDANAGESYVVFGKASGFGASLDLSTLDGTNGFRLDGIDSGDLSGFSVASAGDVNGDGFADIVIGARGGDPGGDANAGESYVVFGKASGFGASLDLATLDGANGFRLDGIDSIDLSGFSVASAGDVNGDGFADIVIGARGGDPGGDSGAGESYVVFGKASGFGASLDLATLNGANGFRLDGIDVNDRSGTSIASAGDMNGDGFADIVIGAYGAGNSAGESYVVFGKGSGFGASLDLSTLNGNNGFRLDGIDGLDFSGISVASAGDVNGDGFADIIIGASGGDPGGDGDAGESYVVFGKGSGFSASLDLATLDGTNGFRLDGIDGRDFSGFSAVSAGDVNGDGFADIVIGARYADPGNRESAGESYVIFGHRALTSVNRIGTGIAQTINGGFGDDTISGLDGNDRLVGWESDDIMLGGEGDDTAGGGIGDDTISGGGGNDRLGGGDGDDDLAGGSGDDFIVGGLGNDFIRAGSGNDVVHAGFGNDMVDGGSGVDLLSFLTVRGPNGVTADLATGISTIGSETASFSGIERLEGTVRADMLTGDGLANTLIGQAGNDTLSGGGGNDILAGGRNGDVMTGGAGNDVFDFNALSESSMGVVNRDVITDFDTNGDQIDLASIDAIAGGVDDAFSFIGAAAFTDLGQVRVFQQGGNTFIDVNASGDTAPDMRIELTGLVALDAADFIL